MYSIQGCTHRREGRGLTSTKMTRKGRCHLRSCEPPIERVLAYIDSPPLQLILWHHGRVARSQVCGIALCDLVLELRCLRDGAVSRILESEEDRS